MEHTFVVDVAPPLPRLNLTATTEDLQKSPQLFFAVRRSPIFPFLCMIECSEESLLTDPHTGL